MARGAAVRDVAPSGHQALTRTFPCGASSWCRRRSGGSGALPVIGAGHVDRDHDTDRAVVAPDAHRHTGSPWGRSRRPLTFISLALQDRAVRVEALGAADRRTPMRTPPSRRSPSSWRTSRRPPLARGRVDLSVRHPMNLSASSVPAGCSCRPTAYSPSTGVPFLTPSLLGLLHVLVVEAVAGPGLASCARESTVSGVTSLCAPSSATAELPADDELSSLPAVNHQMPPPIATSATTAPRR